MGANSYLKSDRDLKDNAIAFNKWLFEHHIVPNNCFIWFDYTKDSGFRELGDFYDMFMMENKVATKKLVATAKTETQLTELINKYFSSADLVIIKEGGKYKIYI